jgi:hypothetical protein
VALVGLTAVRQASPVSDPFAFFQPTVAVTADDREALDRGRTVARTLPARGDVVAVFAAVPIDVPSGRLEAWIDDITAFKRGPQVLAIGRFSDRPVLEDLAGLNFPDRDLEDLGRCRVGDCGLKLTEAEIEEFSRLVHVESSPAALQDALRRLVLQRVKTYLGQGLSALGAYEHRSRPMPIAPAFSRLLIQSPFLSQRLPGLSGVVDRWPNTTGLSAESTHSFVYWSHEHYGGGKPIVSATHVFVRRASGNGNGTPETLVIGKQIFATHYIDAWLGVTALVRNSQTGRAYLVYVNRSSLDVLNGFWAGLVRRILQRRLKAEAPTVLRGIARRLESGMPPAGEGSR